MPRKPIYRNNVNYDRLFLDKHICDFIENNHKCMSILYECIFNNYWFLRELREIIHESVSEDAIDLIEKQYKKIHDLKKIITKKQFVRKILKLLRNNSIRLGELLGVIYNIFPSGEKYVNDCIFMKFY